MSTLEDLSIWTKEDLVNFLVGNNVSVSNINYKGASQAAGIFQGGIFGATGIADGVILSSGDINNGTGPNEATNTSTAFGTEGDADLNTLIDPPNTQDATVLEFDFTTNASQLTFKYVFASEEYNEYVNSAYNDVFGFFVNGQNIALVPGTNTPVSINTVNSGENSAYFVDNVNGSLNIEFDGLTTVLTVTANVTPGTTNSLKLAIADNSDSFYDSAVFLKADSIIGNDPPLAEADKTITLLEDAVATALKIGTPTDPNGDPLTIDVTAIPLATKGQVRLADGTVVTTDSNLTLAQLGGLVFVPVKDANGAAGAFQYKVDDGKGGTDSQTVTLNITPVDDPSPVLKRYGTSGDDTLIGTTGNDWIDGLAGHDIIEGDLGNDTLIGNLGNDTITGDRGNDSLLGGAGNDKLTDDIGNDTLDGSTGNDILSGGSGNDSLLGGAGSDLLQGGTGKDTLIGDVGTESGNDKLNGGSDNDSLVGGNGNDTLLGDSNNDILNGGTGNDSLDGGSDHDNLAGGAGNDILIGNSGNDTLVGGAGNDILFGGGGKDRFIYQSVGDAPDTIKDFDTAADVLDLKQIFANSTYSNPNRLAAYVQLQQIGSNTVVKVETDGDPINSFSNLVTLQNVFVTALSSSNFSV